MLRSIAPALLSLSLLHCGAAVGPGPRPDASAITDVPTSTDANAPFCVLPNGARCPAGTSCPAGDNCNTCSCPAGGGTVACTQRDCAPAPCMRSSDCGGPMLECVFDQVGCDARGHCAATVECGIALPFCGCDGMTYMSCRRTAPARADGRCAGTIGQECSPNRRCTPNEEECVYPENNCATAGRCQALTDCAPGRTYCSCSGVVFLACLGRPTEPNRGRGDCGPILLDAGGPDGR